MLWGLFPLGAAMKRAGLLFLFVLGLLFPARAQETYVLDPAHARIGFSVSHMGLFTTEGQFQRFDSQLAIDPANPEHTTISVRIDAASALVPSSEGEEMLRSPAYFDVGHYPDIRFRSTVIHARSRDDYAIQGELEIRGVTRPVTLSARLTNRQRNTASGMETVDFVVTGTLQRSEFGMVADRSFVADEIALNILARLQLPEPPRGK
jgi:polyisoprenoid-binding protein YceI